MQAKTAKNERDIRRLHRAGMTYKQIADRLGIHESNVCRFMRKRGYRVESRQRIVREKAAA